MSTHERSCSSRSPPVQHRGCHPAPRGMATPSVNIDARIERNIRLHRGKYQVRVSRNGWALPVRVFDTLEEARAARESAAARPIPTPPPPPPRGHSRNGRKGVGVHRTEHNTRRMRLDDSTGDFVDPEGLPSCGPLQPQKMWQVRLQAPAGSKRRFLYGGQFFTRAEAERAALRLDIARRDANATQSPSASASRMASSSFTSFTSSTSSSSSSTTAIAAVALVAAAPRPTGRAPFAEKD